MTIPYVYKMINQKTNEYYIGCRYMQGCDPDENFDVYASSSRTVKHMIKNNPINWKKDVLFIGDIEKVQLEESYLIKQYSQDPLCLNGLRQDGTKVSKPKAEIQLPSVDETAIENMLQTLGFKIRQARKDKRISIEALAKAINVSRTTMSRIENGSIGSEIGSVYKAIQVLGIVIYDTMMGNKC